MNAYELADELQKMFVGEEYDRLIHEIPDGLRQQADRIAELEKENSNLKYEISSGAWQPKEATDQELFNIYAHLQDTYEGNNFPVELGRKILKLYTAPQTKPLNDEEIFDLTTWKKNPYELYVEMEKEDMIAFARAIEERHGIK